MKTLKTKVLDFLCALEGYHQALKMLHWSTTNKAEHLLTDEIDGDILEFEDSLAEATMGCLNIRYGIGDLKTMLPSSKNTTELLSELANDIITLKKEIGDDVKYSGLHNILDDYMSKVNAWNYLRTFK